jgi:hypothetical protein
LGFYPIIHIHFKLKRVKNYKEANGEFGCLFCKLGGGQMAYSTLTVTFPWNKKKKTVPCHRFAYMLHMQ